ncbi:MAG: GAF domain-containing protein [Actinomycetaceae bacterium]|nr:GAF domain-containing protein [Actinomycetaceae bacterium]
MSYSLPSLPSDSVSPGKLPAHLVIGHALALTTQRTVSDALREFAISAAAVLDADVAGARIAAPAGNVYASSLRTPAGIFAASSSISDNRLDALLSDVTPSHPLIVQDTQRDPRYRLLSSSFTHLHNFIGMAIPLRCSVHAILYVGNKHGKISDDTMRVLQLLAAATGIALENVRTIQAAEARTNWASASRNFTAALLEGVDEEDALQLITSMMRSVAHARIALMVLPSFADSWISEFADGPGSAQYVGILFPPDGRTYSVIREGIGIVVNSDLRRRNPHIKELQHFGSALYAPMTVKNEVRGVVILFRYVGDEEFTLADLFLAESMAKQAALALELAAARASSLAALQLEERAKISRDLHDFAIQQLFATGMELTALRDDLHRYESVPHSVVESLDSAIGSIDDSVTQIREIVYSLRNDAAAEPFSARVEKEITQAEKTLGFAPSVVKTFNGKPCTGDYTLEVDSLITQSMADDVIAVIRECFSNIARHAHATSARMQLAMSDDAIHLCVIDNGVGANGAVSRRSGLANIAARAKRHHGTFSIQTAPEGGTVVTFDTAL